GHLQTKGFERSRGKSWMQPKRDMRGQVRLVVPKLEENAHLIRLDFVSQINANSQRVFGGRKIFRSNSLFQLATVVDCRSRKVPPLRPKQALVAALDLAT